MVKIIALVLLLSMLMVGCEKDSGSGGAMGTKIAISIGR